MSSVIEFENVSKLYRLGLISTGTLSKDLKRWWTMNVRHKEDPYLKIGETNDRSTSGTSDFVWALKDINFKVEQGDVVGIIGRNGSGKSTLLKLLSKVTTPTTGIIRAKGRIGSLLEVGTGFHPEMTGRENIFMNGAILGMTKAEIQSKLDAIVDFSGCERYIDTPVKRYSSGMMVRLGFAVAAHLDPEILVVDEVLAVGDAEFQKKAIGKMQDVSQSEGRTVLFVSHNMESIQRLCKKGILLSNGKIDYIGNTEDTIAQYLQRYVLHDNNEWKTSDNRFGADGIRFTRFAITRDGKLVEGIVHSEDKIHVEIEFELQKNIPDLTVGVSIFDERGQYVYRSLLTDLDETINSKLIIGKNRISATLPIDFLRSGNYTIALDASRHNSSWIIDPYNDTEHILSFRKDQSDVFSTMHSTSGIIAPKVEWAIL